MRSRAGSREMEQIQPHRQYNRSSLQHRQRVVWLPRRHSVRRQAHAASGRPRPLPFWRLTLRWWGTGRYWCWPAGPWSWLGAQLSHQWRWQFWCEPPKPGGSHWSCCPAFQLCSQWTKRGWRGDGKDMQMAISFIFPMLFRIRNSTWHAEVTTAEAALTVSPPVSNMWHHVIVRLGEMTGYFLGFVSDHVTVSSSGRLCLNLLVVFVYSIPKKIIHDYLISLSWGSTSTVVLLLRIQY